MKRLWNWKQLIPLLILFYPASSDELKYIIISYQLKLTKMLTELANLNHCAVPFLRRAATNMCWYCYTSQEIYPISSRIIWAEAQIIVSYYKGKTKTQEIIMV